MALGALLIQSHSGLAKQIIGLSNRNDVCMPGELEIRTFCIRFKDIQKGAIGLSGTPKRDKIKNTEAHFFKITY